MAQQLSRAEALAQVRRAVALKFPGAAITSNDDANPATPMAITATWRRGTIVKAIRAESIRSTPEEFSQRAGHLLAVFQTNNVPARYQTKPTDEE